MNQTSAPAARTTPKAHEVKNIPLANIVPDESQPRKNFDAHKLGQLKKSITNHGILTPLVVEKHGSNYLLVDGERRYRAAKELGVKEVPALIQEPKSGVDRLVQQFHIQEQHEGWSNTEKAAAIIDLAKALNLSVASTAELLSIPPQTISTYLSFGKLMSREMFQREEIPLKYARPIITLREFVKKEYIKQLDEEFDKGQERQLEHAVIKRIKSGEISRSTDMVKLRDSIKLNPKVVEKFIKDDKLTLSKIFLDTSAKVAHALRNISSAANMINTYTNVGLPLGLKALIEEDEDCQRALAHAKAAIDKLI